LLIGTPEEKTTGGGNMGSLGKSFAAVAAGICLLLTAPGQADAKPAYANAAPEPAATAEKKGEPAATAMADKESPCPRGCPHCREGCPKDCPHRHGKEGMHPMREKMTGHLEEMKKTVSDYSTISRSRT